MNEMEMERPSVKEQPFCAAIAVCLWLSAEDAGSERLLTDDVIAECEDIVKTTAGFYGLYKREGHVKTAAGSILSRMNDESDPCDLQTACLREIDDLSREWRGVDPEAEAVFATAVMQVISADGIYSDRETECVELLVHHVGFRKELFEGCAALLKEGDIENMPEVESLPEHGDGANAADAREDASNDRAKSKRTLRLKIALYAAMVCVVLFGCAMAYTYFRSSDLMPGNDIIKYLKEAPQLVFKRVSFSKYLVYGRPDGVNRHMEKLNICLMKGSADFKIDLSTLRFNEEQTDRINKVLVFDYDGPRDGRPLVDIMIEELHDVQTLDAVAMSESEAEAIAASVGVASGIIGGYFGSKLGDGFISRLVGTGVGAAAAGGGGYLMTKNFLTGMKLSSSGVADKEEIRAKAYPLIAMEIADGDWGGVDSEDGGWGRWSSSFVEYYKQEMRASLMRIFGSMGWREVRIN